MRLARCTLALALLATLQGQNSDGAATSLPNIVLVFADDLGYGDLACYGNPTITTPNLDRLAAEGVRFTDFYVSQPVCSASRASLLTGCYANRVGIHGALGPNAKHGIASEEETLAEVCRSKGYATIALGKWHLGHHVEFLPQRHGFDEYYGIPYSNDMHPKHPQAPKSYPPLPLIEGEETIETDPDQDRFTHEFTTRACEFMRKQVAASRPFFVYLAHPMPHVPLAASASARGKSRQGLYGDVIEEIDASMGQVLDSLRELQIADNTLVMFASDNGPWLSYGDHAGSTGGLREGKGTTFEGGVRVPFLARWPGKIPPGHVCREPAMTIDVLPTLARWLDAPLPTRAIDGLDIAPLFTGAEGARSPHAALFFWYHNGDLEAMRSGKWKLHFPHGYRTMRGRDPGHGGKPGAYDSTAKIGLALYDLAGDGGETTDVASAHPDVVRDLSARADATRTQLGDRLTQTVGSDVREPGRR